MVRASLLYSYRCLAIPLNGNKNPAPFFLLCLQEEIIMKKTILPPEAWQCIRQYPKITLSEQQKSYLSEVYDLSDAPVSLKELLMNNNCVALDNAGNNYLYYGDVHAFIDMLIFDINNNLI